MVSPSELTERVAIQVKTSTRTSSGGEEVTWTTLPTLWARTWGATAAERQTAGADRSQVTRHFCVRYFPALTDKHRVVYAGQVHDITFVNSLRTSGETYFDAKVVDGVEAR